MNRILRIALIPAIVAVLAVAGVGAAYASTPSLPPNSLVVRGTISGINQSIVPPTVTITPETGLPVTVNVLIGTVITKSGVGTIGMADLALGNQVVAIYDQTTLAASKISVRTSVEQQGNESFVGTINSVGLSSFVLTTKQQGDVTINVDTNTVFRIPSMKNATLANLKVGERVAVLATMANGGNLALHVNLIPGKALGLKGDKDDHGTSGQPEHNGKAERTERPAVKLPHEREGK